MSREIIKHPSREEINKWGILVYVDAAERKRILEAPHGQFQGEIKRLTKEVDLIKFPRKKKSIVQEYHYNPNFKPKPHKEPDHEEPISSNE